MKTKRNYKQEIKDWWIANHKVIKTGAICGLIGLGYGFIKGMSASDKLWIDGLSKAVTSGESSDDDAGLTDYSYSDDGFVELVQMEVSE